MAACPNCGTYLASDNQHWYNDSGSYGEDIHICEIFCSCGHEKEFKGKGDVPLDTTTALEKFINKLCLT